MGITVGRLVLEDLKLGTSDILNVYIGNMKVWPIESDIDLDGLTAILSCIMFGQWSDILPWNDEIPWRDSV